MPELMLIGTAHIIDLDSPLERYIKEFDPDNALSQQVIRVFG